MGDTLANVLEGASNIFEWGDGIFQRGELVLF